MPVNDEPSASAQNAEGSDAAAKRASNNSEATGTGNSVQHLPNIAAGILSSDDDARRSEMCEAALGYAAKGWRVIPVRWIEPDGTCSCRRGPECPSPGKHPVHDEWPDVATCEPMDVAAWWRPEPEPGVLAEEWFPYANIGIVTGRESGLFVLDMDTYAGGEQTLGAYERRHGDLPGTRVHSTSRGGTHYFWQHPGFEVRNSAAKVLGKGLDIRGERGFVVAPPSMGAHGAYELNAAHDMAPAEAPEWLLDLLRNYNKEQTGAAISGQVPAAATGAARKYAEAALRTEAQKMRESEEGTRNDTLNQCAFVLGTLGGAGLITEEAAWTTLSEAASASGLGAGETRGTFLSGWRKGLENPRNVQWRAMETDWPVRPRTEFGLADRMADHYGDTLRWCPERSTWMEYLRGVWMTSFKEAGEWHAQMMIRRLLDTEGLSYDDTVEVAPDGTTLPSARDLFEEWVGKQQTRKAVSSAARLATALPLMQMSQNTFDADPLLLNATNGAVRLDTGEVLPHAPEQRMTLQCAAAYEPGAPAPRWDAFLRRVQPDPEVRAYLQRVAGYCATGLTVEQVFFLFNGKGANGKSLFQNVLAHVLGSYSQTIPVDTLMASSIDGRIPNDVARMAGRRFLIASETKAGKALDEQKLKQLTGGDTISARYMRAEWFEFRPVGKIQLTTNHLPKMSDDAATWRRVHLINWPEVIPEEERDPYLQEKILREEASGVLAWIVAGAVAWREEGLSPPRGIVEARNQYQEEEDVVGQFFLECLEPVKPVNGAVGRSASEIWHTYDAWAKREGHPHLGQKALTARLRKRSEYVRSNGWAGFPGLQIQLFGGPPADGAPG